MIGIRSITTATLALGLSVAVPTFAKAAERGHNDRNDSRTPAHVERRVESRTPATVERRAEPRAQAHVERRAEPQRERVIVERSRIEREHVIRDIHVNRDFHYGNYGHYDRGIRFGVNVGPVYPVYPSYPVYVGGDCDLSVNLDDVPWCVFDTADRECGGPVQSVRLIRQNGVEFYRLIVDGREGAFEVHVDRAGRLISIGRC